MRHDAGVPADETALVFSLTPDNSTFSVANTRTGATVSGYATTYYAALRGGGQIYKTVDGGERWTPANTGLPAGAEVFRVEVDCAFGAAGTAGCANPRSLFAATSAGLYRSVDAGASWTLFAFEHRAVRNLAFLGDHAAGTLPAMIAGVDDAVRIYTRASSAE